MRVELETPDLRAVILPDLGAGLAALELRHEGRWRPLLRRAPGDVSWFNHLASYLLAPWSNRIPQGRYTFRGREHQLSPDWPDGTAIHGLVKDRRWRLVQRCPISVTLELDDAYRVRYELVDGLRTTLTLRNTTSDTIPAGLGFHPFFPRTLWNPRDQLSIRYDAAGRYPAANMIPTAPAHPDAITDHLRAGKPIAPLALDDVFLGSAHGAAIRWPASGITLRYECSPALTHAVLYTQEPDFICFEPVTMMNDGFNLHDRGWPDTGVVELAPGQELTADWTMHIERT